MDIKIIIKDTGTDVVKAIHESEAFIEHLAEKIESAFGLKKGSATPVVAQAINTAPTVEGSASVTTANSGETESPESVSGSSPSTIPSSTQETTIPASAAPTLTLASSTISGTSA